MQTVYIIPTYLQLPESIKSRIIFIRCVSEPLIDHHPVCFSPGYRGKTVDFQEVSHCHRTTTAYFLNHGKWKDDGIAGCFKKAASSKPFIGKHSVPDNRFTVLWMIRLLHIPGLRHRRFIQSKLRIFINHI